MLKRPDYLNVGAAVSCPAGWLVVPARLAGVTLVAYDMFTLPDSEELLNYRPKWDFLVVDQPFAVLDEPDERFLPQWRVCDISAQEFLGWPRCVALKPVPHRQVLLDRFGPDEDDPEAMALDTGVRLSDDELLEKYQWLTRDDVDRLSVLRDVDKQIEPFHARSVFAGSPELSFAMMNSDIPLKSSPFHKDGFEERLGLIEYRMPGTSDILLIEPWEGWNSYHALMAGGLLWTARRAAGKAFKRLPMDPEWSEMGIRVDYTR